MVCVPAPSKSWRLAMQVLLANLERHARVGIVLTWGNDVGNGHVNNRNTS